MPPGSVFRVLWDIGVGTSSRGGWHSLRLVLDLAGVVQRVALVSELVSLSKLTFYLKQVGMVSNE